jgi:hypothetical protein
MTIQTYALIDNLPPPVTPPTAPIQSFTDAMTGEVWIARGNVYSGGWRKARDVVHFHAFRNAAYNLPTASGIIAFDTNWADNFSLYTGSPNYGCQVPVQGFYRAFAYLEVTVAVAGTYIQMNLQQNNTTNWSSDNYFSTRASGGLCARTQALMYLNAGDIVNLHAYQPQGYPCVVTGNIPPCHLEVSYLGTG